MGPDDAGRIGAVSGATEVVGLIGHPVRHSVSPAIHNAAFAACGIDGIFVVFDVDPGRGAEAVRACRSLSLRGLSVTMPHKGTAAATVDRLTDRARRLGAVNCVTRDGDELVGDSTDGPGFVAALREETGFDPAGATAVVLGAGGAGRAVVLALAEEGAREVIVVNRTSDAAESAAALAPGVSRVGRAADVSTVDLVVNATSVGMATDDPDSIHQLPLDAEQLGAGQVVADIVYHPLTTELLRAAAARGATTVGGLGMLVHQAAFAFASWTGVEPPVDAMWAAARAAVAPTS